MMKLSAFKTSSRSNNCDNLLVLCLLCECQLITIVSTFICSSDHQLFYSTHFFIVHTTCVYDVLSLSFVSSSIRREARGTTTTTTTAVVVRCRLLVAYASLVTLPRHTTDICNRTRTYE